MSWNTPDDAAAGDSGWSPTEPPSQFPPPPPPGQYAPPPAPYPPTGGYAPPPPGGVPPQAWSGPGAPYAQPGYGVNPHEGRATTVLILGILGLVFCGFLAPVAWVMGNGVKRDSEMAGFAEPGTNKAGRICGMIGSALIILGVVAFIVLIAVGAFAGSGSSIN